jgi:8-oxo-dGTP pyrophosphatase MutT (NUDIX family)
MPREKSAGAIIFRGEPFDTAQGKKYILYFLLLHYSSGHWEFPKGHIEKGELEEETVRRELFEETGINDIKIIPGFKKYIKYFFRQYPTKTKSGESHSAEASLDRAKRPWVFKLVTFFVAETKTKEIKISSEHVGFVWLPIKEAIAKTTFKNSKKLLKEADDFIRKNNLS